MHSSNLKAWLIEFAKECVAKGPGYAQEYSVLREAAERLGINGDLKKQQELLTCWHDLFREGVLSWGYDIDNPTSPFFHFSERDS